MRIACVDDDPVFLEILTAELGKTGKDEVATFGSAEAVFAHVHDEQQAVDLFLVDIRMPGISGIELVQALRELPSHHRTPIVMVTGMSDRRFVDHAFAAGATDYITKPLDALEFGARLGVIRALVAERQSAAALLEQTPGAQARATVGFDEHLLLEELDNSVEFLALENYLLTLGKARLFSHSAIAFHLDSAEYYHKVCDGPAFLDVLNDVGHAVFTGLKAYEFLISYAGRGDFVAFATSPLMIDPEDLEHCVNATLSQFEETYILDRLPVPRVKAGTPVRPGLFSMGQPTMMLHKAVNAVNPLRGSAMSPSRLIA